MEELIFNVWLLLALDVMLVGWLFANHIRRKGGLRGLGIVLVPLFVYIGWLWNQMPHETMVLLLTCTIMPAALLLRFIDVMKQKLVNTRVSAELMTLIVFTAYSASVFYANFHSNDCRSCDESLIHSTDLYAIR